MTRAALATFVLVTLAAWLAAQCVLQLWHGPQDMPSPLVAAPAVPDLLVRHWGAPAVVLGDDLPLTSLAIEYLGGLRTAPVSATVVVLRYQQQQRTLTVGQRLAPGIVLDDIDALGLIFDNHGRRERLPWPPQRPITGLKRQG